MVRGGLSWAPTGSAAASQGWSGHLHDPSLGLSYLWGSGMLTLVYLEGAERKHSGEKGQGTGPAFVGLILALYPPQRAVMIRMSCTSHQLWEAPVPGLGLEMAPLPSSTSWLC